LDIGSGIGRHSAFAHSLSPHARITVVEINQRLREYCISIVPNASGYEQFSNVPTDALFALRLLRQLSLPRKSLASCQPRMGHPHRICLARDANED
jgi:hypothetical protein